MNKLFIDTSTKALILVLQKDDTYDFVFELTKNNHSEKLMPEIEKLFKKHQLLMKDIDEIYVTEGPGSYTGVRIGVTIAKMLCYTLNKPLFKISSLKVIASSYKNDYKYIIPIIDARRGNAFSAFYETDTNSLKTIYEEKLYHFENLIKDVKQYTNKKVYIVGLDSKGFSITDTQFHVIDSLKEDFNYKEIFNLDFEKVDNIHIFSPDYKRIPEAERNLL